MTKVGKCGVKCSELPDGIQIHGVGRETPDVLQRDLAHIHCYKDHRIAMSFALAGLKTAGIKIENPDCVAKTYPGYWDALASLGVEFVKTRLSAG